MGFKQVEKAELLRLRRRRFFSAALNHTDTPGIVEEQAAGRLPKREQGYDSAFK
jgi:hypothetical protein